MAAHHGVTNITDLTKPAGSYVAEASVAKSVEVATVKDENGNVVIAKPKKRVRETHVIKGNGDPGIAAVTAGAMEKGTIKIASAKGSESSDDFPTFEITGIKITDTPS